LFKCVRDLDEQVAAAKVKHRAFHFGCWREPAGRGRAAGVERVARRLVCAPRHGRGELISDASFVCSSMATRTRSLRWIWAIGTWWRRRRREQSFRRIASVAIARRSSQASRPSRWKTWRTPSLTDARSRFVRTEPDIAERGRATFLGAPPSTSRGLRPRRARGRGLMNEDGRSAGIIYASPDRGPRSAVEGHLSCIVRKRSSRSALRASVGDDGRKRAVPNPLEVRL